MKRYLTLSAALLLALSLTACGDKNKDGGSKVLAKVNGTVISTETFDWLIKEQIPAGTPVDEALRTRARDHLVQREVILQAAHKAGLDKDPAIKMRMEYVRDEQLVNAYLKDWMDKHKADDAALKAEFEKRVAAAGDTEYKARHILVDKEDDAKAIIAKLQKGAKFADLVKASKDTGSAANGGDLGWARPSTFVPEFAKALATLSAGKFTTEPVKTQFGYHVILLDETRKAESPKFEDVKQQLAQGLDQEALQAYVKDLVAKAKVE